MRDFARSDSPAVQRQLDRLGALSIPEGRLGLDTIRALLNRLGNPHHRLPPVFHVAGTNGKGSTCAFLRAMLEEQGYTVHVTTSPHLVRYNERIRLAGTLIDDDRLAELLAEVLDAGEDLGPSFFEVTIAAAFSEFARVPADACVVEVGLGGRFDATNVLEPESVAACGIASLGIDHERFLLTPEEGAPTEPIARIAFEKAGIAKPGVPLVCLSYPADARAQIQTAAERAKAQLALLDYDWDVEIGLGLSYRDRRGSLTPPRFARRSSGAECLIGCGHASPSGQAPDPARGHRSWDGPGALACTASAPSAGSAGRSARSLAGRRAQCRCGPDVGQALFGPTPASHHRHA